VPKADLSNAQLSQRFQNTAMLAATSKSIMYIPSLWQTSIPSFDLLLVITSGASLPGAAERTVVDGGLNSSTLRREDLEGCVGG